VIRQQAQKTSLLGLLTCFVVGAIVGTATGARAEGSRTLYPDTAPTVGNYRANLEWRPNNQYGTLIPRSSLMKVYANAGEYILLGSSAVGVGAGDIAVFDPGIVTTALADTSILTLTPSFKCSTQRALAGSPANMGKITSRTLETDGPTSVTGVGPKGVGTGYTPCYYRAPTSGVYDVILYGTSAVQDGTSGDLAKPSREIALTSISNFNTDQGNSVAAWDITVRSSNSSIADINGRVFSYSFAMFLNSNGTPINFKLYPVTNDGYRYELDLRKIDPNGFLLYGNQVGFFDQDKKTPLYHDVLGSTFALLNIQGGAKLALPQFPIFLNTLDPSVLSFIPRYNIDGTIETIGIPTAVITPVVSTLTFSGNQANNTSVINSNNFGNFTFDSNVTGNYEIIISRDGTNFDPTALTNRSLRGLITTAGVQTIPWNGKDNSGTNFPVGVDYKVTVKVHAGEYHFPLLDAENAQNGGVTITVLNGANLNSTTAFYDDRGYRTVDTYDAAGNLVSAGQTVGTPGTVLTGTNAPSPAFSDPVLGFPSSGTQRAYGNGSTSGFGDAKGLDLWTYLASNKADTKLNIIPVPPQLLIVKRITKVKTTAITTLIDQIGGTSDTSDNNVLWPSRTGTATQMDAAGTVLATSTSSFSTLLQGATNLTNPTPRPKEELEYTIYYLSSGGQTAKNASICDFVPVNTTYVLGTLQLKSGTSAAVTVSDTPGDTDGGFYPIGTAQAAMHAACNTPDSTNTTRGAVVVNLGDVLNATSTGTPTSSYGYIRFRVVVQ
jgi:uncharacterized repeat protein (TIGR01451 family)